MTSDFVKQDEGGQKLKRGLLQGASGRLLDEKHVSHPRDPFFRGFVVSHLGFPHKLPKFQYYAINRPRPSIDAI